MCKAQEKDSHMKPIWGKVEGGIYFPIKTHSACTGLKIAAGMQHCLWPISHIFWLVELHSSRTNDHFLVSHPTPPPLPNLCYPRQCLLSDTAPWHPLARSPHNQDPLHTTVPLCLTSASAFCRPENWSLCAQFHYGVGVFCQLQLSCWTVVLHVLFVYNVLYKTTLWTALLRGYDLLKVAIVL